jgi:hypothetical protein
MITSKESLHPDRRRDARGVRLNESRIQANGWADRKDILSLTCLPLITAHGGDKLLAWLCGELLGRIGGGCRMYFVNPAILQALNLNNLAALAVLFQSSSLVSIHVGS